MTTQDREAKLKEKINKMEQGWLGYRNVDTKQQDRELLLKLKAELKGIQEGKALAEEKSCLNYDCPLCIQAKEDHIEQGRKEGKALALKDLSVNTFINKNGTKLHPATHCRFCDKRADLLIGCCFNCDNSEQKLKQAKEQGYKSGKKEAIKEVLEKIDEWGKWNGLREAIIEELKASLQNSQKSPRFEKPFETTDYETKNGVFDKATRMPTTADISSAHSDSFHKKKEKKR